MAIIGPHLGAQFIFLLASRRTNELYEKTASDITDNQNFAMLETLHHISSGLKAYCTDYAYQAMDSLRQACGGAGFLLSSGLSYNFVNNAPLVTYEGVNVIMYQQSSRKLLKVGSKVAKGKKVDGMLSYLNDTEQLISSKCQAKSIEEFTTVENLLHTLKVRSAF